MQNLVLKKPIMILNIRNLLCGKFAVSLGKLQLFARPTLLSHDAADYQLKLNGCSSLKMVQRICSYFMQSRKVNFMGYAFRGSLIRRVSLEH